MDNLMKLTEKMKKYEINQMIVTSPSDIFYLTGIMIDPGERFFCLSVSVKEDPVIIINELFRLEYNDIKIIYYPDSKNPMEILDDILNEKGIVGVDKNLRAEFLLEIINRKEKISLVNSSYLLEELRMYKTQKEIELMRASSKINDEAMVKVSELISEMLSEKQMVRAIQGIFENLGADNISFSPIVAYGKNAANPHHVPTYTKLKNNELVIVDMGCVKNYYCSDMTRTFSYGKPDKEMEKIYSIVKKANEKAIETVKPGALYSDVDKIAREIITESGYGKYFTHRTGHSIGIDVHEPPNVSDDNKMVLEPGMIFSIEPGIYLPNKGGVRIEDLVIVTNSGVEVLNFYSKDLEII